MTVFKNYFKIVKKHSLMIGLYSVIFIAIAVIFSTLDNSAQLTFLREKPNIAIKNNSPSELGQLTSQYLHSISEVKEIEDNQLEDALFNTEIVAILTLPQDFEETRKIEIQNRVDDMSSLLITSSVDRFLKTMGVYINQDLSLQESYQRTVDDLNQVVEVTLAQDESKSPVQASVMYFNPLNYVLTAQIILVVTLIMNAYKKEPLLSRQKVSAVSKRSFELQLILGHIIMGILIWLLYILVFVILSRDQVFEPSFVWFCLNSFVLMLTGVSFAYLISKFITTDSGVSVVTNTYALGTSFVSGAFVPLELLPDFTVAISKLFPAYYYISNNHAILNNPSFDSIKINLLIMMGFVVIFIVLSSLLKLNKKA